MNKQITLVLLTVILVLGACTTAPDAKKLEQKDTVQPSGEMKSFDVSAYNWGFEPAVITVNKGDRVHITFTGKGANHGIALPDFRVSTQPFAPGETQVLEFVADKAGTFTYFCNVYCGAGHNEMQGQIVVNEA